MKLALLQVAQSAGCSRTQTAMLQAAYNLLYGVWKYKWDADCELFLRILSNEVREDVYIAQVNLQVSGQCTGRLPKGSAVQLMRQNCF